MASGRRQCQDLVSSGRELVLLTGRTTGTIWFLIVGFLLPSEYILLLIQCAPFCQRGNKRHPLPHGYSHEACTADPCSQASFCRMAHDHTVNSLAPTEWAGCSHAAQCSAHISSHDPVANSQYFLLMGLVGFFQFKANPFSVLLGQEWLSEVMSSGTQRIQSPFTKLRMVGENDEHFAALVALWERKPRCRKLELPA